MKIVGIEGVQEFMDDGGTGSRCNMIVELRTKEQFRVPIGQDTHSMLTELGNMVAPQSDSRTRVAPSAAQPSTLCEAQSLEDFAKDFIFGPNSEAPVPSQRTAEQQELVGQLSSLMEDEAVGPVEGGADDPLSQLRKVGMFSEPTDVLSVMGNQAAEVPGSDLVESFEDTSDNDENDPGEESDDGEIAEQF